MSRTVIETGICECIAAPMGENGMEGYVEGTQYKYEHVTYPKSPMTYYRVYHNDTYYETCGVNQFNQWFKKIPDDQV